MTVPTRSAEIIEQMLRDMGFMFDNFTMNAVSGRCTFKKAKMSVSGQIMETSLPGGELDVRDVSGSKLRPADLAEAFTRMSRK